MPILYICKTSVASFTEDGQPASKLPPTVRDSEWNSIRKETIEGFRTSRNHINKQDILNSAETIIGEITYNSVVFDSLEIASNFISLIAISEDHRLLISKWNELYNITREHKFYNIDSQKINSDIDELLEILTDADIEPSIDVSTLY